MRELKAQGDTWHVAVDIHAPHPGVRAVVFHCISNPQRPYRVAEVPDSLLPSSDSLGQLSEDEIERLFERSDPMDFSHDPRAASDHVGEPPRQRLD